MNGNPTKSNLMAVKRSYDLAKLGYDLLDRKRNILLREMLTLMDEASTIEEEVSKAFTAAYSALYKAHMTLGEESVLHIAESIHHRDDITVLSRTIMGIEFPQPKVQNTITNLEYGFSTTNIYFDDAYQQFNKLKVLLAKTASIESSISSLATAIKQTKVRANALKNIVIPDMSAKITFMTSYIEEKEREAFTSLKVIKANKDKKAQNEAKDQFTIESII